MKISNLETSRLKSKLIKDGIRNGIRDENGSAIIEFVIFALPLFIPMVIYLTSVNQSAQIQYDARNFARQVARVYVTSPTQELTGARIQAVTDAFVSKSFAANGIALPPKIVIHCSLNPCLTPNGKVEVKVSLSSKETGYLAIATAIQTVDSWRDS
jgi:Flp pilus assembly protein TadG